MLSHFTGFIISATVHIAVLAMAFNLVEKPRSSKPKPIPLTVAMFKEKPAIVPAKKLIAKPLPTSKEIIKPVALIKKVKLPVKTSVKRLPKPKKAYKKPHKTRPKKIIKKIKLSKVVKPKRPVIRKKVVRKQFKKRISKQVQKYTPKPVSRKIKKVVQRAHQPIKKAIIRRPVQRKVVHRPVRRAPQKVARRVVQHSQHRAIRRPIHNPIRKTVYRAPVRRAVKTVPRKVVHRPTRRVPNKPISHRPKVKRTPVHKPPTKTINTNNAQTGKLRATYKNRLRQLIQTNKRYPKRAKKREKQGTVIVSFVILANGTINNIRIAKSSGHSILDKAALKAVAKVSGKLPFSQGINKTRWVLSVPVVYQLR